MFSRCNVSSWPPTSEKKGIEKSPCRTHSDRVLWPPARVWTLVDHPGHKTNNDHLTVWPSCPLTQPYPTLPISLCVGALCACVRVFVRTRHIHQPSLSSLARHQCPITLPLRSFCVHAPLAIPRQVSAKPNTCSGRQGALLAETATAAPSAGAPAHLLLVFASERVKQTVGRPQEGAEVGCRSFYILFLRPLSWPRRKVGAAVGGLKMTGCQRLVSLLCAIFQCSKFWRKANTVMFSSKQRLFEQSWKLSHIQPGYIYRERK